MRRASSALLTALGAIRTGTDNATAESSAGINEGHGVLACKGQHTLAVHSSPLEVQYTCDRCERDVEETWGCRICDFDVCLPCMAAAGFAAARIAEGAGDGSDEAMRVPAVVQRIVPDVVGIVLRFACGSAAEAMRIASVCRSWYKGMVADRELWQQLYARRWPQRRMPSSVTMTTYRSRALAGRRLRVAHNIAESTLTPIEHCEFSYQCPMIEEALRELASETVMVGDVTVTTPVFFCDVCTKKVYHVGSQQEVDHHQAAGNCIVFHSSPSIAVKGTTAYYVLGNVADAGAAATRYMNALIGRIVKREPTAVVTRHGLHGKVNVKLESRFLRVNELTFQVRLFEHPSERGQSSRYLKPPKPDSSPHEVKAAVDRQARTILAKMEPAMDMAMCMSDVQAF
jgi:hypothetical protein